MVQIVLCPELHTTAPHPLLPPVTTWLVCLLYKLWSFDKIFLKAQIYLLLLQNSLLVIIHALKLPTKYFQGCMAHMQQSCAELTIINSSFCPIMHEWNWDNFWRHTVHLQCIPNAFQILCPSINTIIVFLIVHSGSCELLTHLWFSHYAVTSWMTLQEFLSTPPSLFWVIHYQRFIPSLEEHITWELKMP